ncbi:hypothetical protein GCM10007392_24700 [Saccharospirillum salsuginis]|uniref:Uncharacterized protein n=1 Tax=Saccharospirillum salsuginis TaxID=418750 RepID=A0A918KAH6_9GAMM|nr:hypothetical protein GCM10007392_24700 [Saccharospirillum salsuginis]
MSGRQEGHIGTGIIRPDVSGHFGGFRRQGEGVGGDDLGGQRPGFVGQALLGQIQRQGLADQRARHKSGLLVQLLAHQ